MSKLYDHKRLLSLAMSWSPGCDQSSADCNLENMNNETDEEDEVPDQNKWQTKEEILLGVLFHICDGVDNGGEIIEEGEEDRNNAAD